MYGVSALEIFEDIAMISLARVPCEPKLLREIFGYFAENGINVDMISQSAPAGGTVALSFTCAGDDMVRVLKLSKELGETCPGMKPFVVAGCCKLRLYGEEMRELRGVFAKAMEALGGVPVELRLVTTSETDISLLVDHVRLEEAAAALRESFGL